MEGSGDRNQLANDIFGSGDDRTESPKQLAFKKLLGHAVKLRASDLHIDPMLEGFVLRVRVDGALRDLARIDQADGGRLVNQFKADLGIPPGANFVPRESRHKYEVGGQDLDLRVTLVPCISGEKLAIRLLEPERVVHRIDDLGVDGEGLQRFRDWLDGTNGMFLVSGATGCGKTTTLYALLHELAEADKHVLTIEDPVEYEIDGINQIQVDRTHGLDFALGLKSMLRLDPDYMMVGELRDLEAAKVAARAANSGQVLLSTIHARDAVSTISALRNFGMSGHQIAVTVAVIVNQRLVRKLCPNCRSKEPISDSDRSWLEARGLRPPSATWRSSGCESCMYLGYKGRTGVFEIWRLTGSDYDLLLAGADERNLRRKLAQGDHRTLAEDAWAKVQDGITSLAEIRHATGSIRADDWQAP